MSMHDLDDIEVDLGMSWVIHVITKLMIIHLYIMKKSDIFYVSQDELKV